MRTLILLLTVLILSCSEQHDDLIFSYFPEKTLLDEGVVNKYYEHFYPKETTRKARTNISYALTQRKSANRFSVKWYNAGFELTEINEFRVEDGVVFLDSSISFYGFANLDTMISKISSPVYEDWNNQKSDQSLIELMDFDGDKYEVVRLQKRTIDSTILNKPAKVFIGNRNLKSIRRDTTFQYKYAFTYVQGIGLYNSLSTRPNGRSVTELVEQMPVSAFKEMSRHQKKRVAYIDPVNTLDDAIYFELCGHENAIVDYYNSSPDVRYADGKGEMKKIIRGKLEREKLHGESGYLTFRFVVNCKGETGRYVLEQSDLNYQKKQFSSETIDHLYQITNDLKRWQPAVIRDKGQDAYVYLTYKLQNGVVTDVLP